jgi:eukaryotic-like serine/threonine-protein kinase
MITDSSALRELLAALMPGINIGNSPSPSGQRVVYFCHFAPPTKPVGMEKWGAVVVKVSEGISAAQIAYLEKEIEILNSLKSRHYPTLLWNETFTEDPRTNEKLPNRLFVTVEERIESRPLRAVMNDYREARAMLTLLRDLVNALEPLWTHKAKLVHRDLKPENILIRKTGEVAIIDLGIIREEGAKGVTLSFIPHGPCTPHYASPEQAKNDKKNITFKSDFFSLGVIAYELIAGKLPFGAYDADND